MLTNAHEEHRNICSVDHANQRANHIPNCIALGDDEAIQGPAPTECCIEVTGLSDRVRSNQCLKELARWWDFEVHADLPLQP